MKKPFVICHMVCSVDGRTQGAHWPRDKKDGNVFEDTAATIDSQGWLVGRKTMSEFCSKKPRRKRKGRFAVPKTDYIAPHQQKTYAVGLDPSGRLHWEQGHVDTEHVIAVLTERVSAEYLDHLRRAGVSYIFGGKTALDLRRVLEKLHALFGIRRITLQGGGLNNGSFLNAGLVDELSLIVMPYADGGIGTQSVFDIAPRDKKKPAHRLQLLAHRIYKSKYVWLRYAVEN